VAEKLESFGFGLMSENILSPTLKSDEFGGRERIVAFVPLISNLLPTSESHPGSIFYLYSHLPDIGSSTIGAVSFEQLKVKIAMNSTKAGRSFFMEQF
jgi:hypothetical protein